MATSNPDGFYQPTLFELPPPPAAGWRPAELAADLHVRWTPPAELEGRLDASYYVIARRPAQLLQRLTCPLTTLDAWAAVNPAGRRLPMERGYILHDHCLYAQTRDIHAQCWVMGPQLTATTVAALPSRAAFRAEPGDLLLPRVYSSIHRTVMVVETALPLMVSDAFALLQPHSRRHGLVLLALLHHRILGEQLWALASGTTVRSVAVDQVSSLRVPTPPAAALQALAGQVEQLLAAQMATSFPLHRVGLVDFWQARSPRQHQAEAVRMLTVLFVAIEDALSAC
jgi:hypothetical protein